MPCEAMEHRTTGVLRAISLTLRRTRNFQTRPRISPRSEDSIREQIWVYLADSSKGLRNELLEDERVLDDRRAGECMGRWGSVRWGSGRRSALRWKRGQRAGSCESGYSGFELWTPGTGELQNGYGRRGRCAENDTTSNVHEKDSLHDGIVPAEIAWRQALCGPPAAEGGGR